ncbi:MAG: outer membrane lipoprotein-sorting protein [Spirochaetales bacterium]|nr:outer membrane lipoprotein-sorting protein [Spirochaetales bacterium]
MLKRKILYISLFICINFYLFSEVDIEAVVKRADALLESVSTYSTSEMTVYKAGVPQPTMEMEDYSLIEDGTTYSLSIYRAPAKMKGTAYLIIGNDIWVKFGNTGRIRKLSSSAKKNSAGGTDFSYNDMSNNNTGLSKQYSITLLDEKISVDGTDCYKAELVKRPDSDGAYEKLIIYITRDKEHYVKIEYVEDNAIIKTLTFTDWKTTGERSYPFIIKMESHTKDSYTEYKILSIEFESPRVKKNLFTQTYLKQIK